MQPRSPEPASPGELREHITATYLDQRVGIAVIAFAFPILLAAGGWLWYRLPLQPSMSAYYHTGMRNVFVGVLFAIGGALYLYKGFSRAEDYVLNAAGALAVVVALVPTRPPGTPHTVASTLHWVAAVLFFLCTAYVCIFRASDTLPLVGDGRLAEQYDRLYRLLGSVMILSPISAWVLHEALPYRSTYVFLVEVVCVWTFAAYWMAKGIEIAQSQAEERIACGELVRDDRGNLIPEGAVSRGPDRA
jgi:hypothetical protein